jgi:hypothetical protein
MGHPANRRSDGALSGAHDTRLGGRSHPLTHSGDALPLRPRAERVVLNSGDT